MGIKMTRARNIPLNLANYNYPENPGVTFIHWSTANEARLYTQSPGRPTGPRRGRSGVEISDSMRCVCSPGQAVGYAERPYVGMPSAFFRLGNMRPPLQLGLRAALARPFYP